MPICYISLSGGNVEIGGLGSLTVRTDGHHWSGPSSAAAQMSMDTSEPKPPFDEQFVLKDEKTGVPVAFMPYCLTDAAGNVIGQGVTDAEGRVLRVHCSDAQEIRIFY